MAPIALTPEASAVRIIVFMTGVAIRRLIDFRFYGFVVALLAAEVLVCTLQLEICPLIMLKQPYAPVVRVMAMLAIRAQRGFVLIIVLVTGIAF
jgi:hypothetical protein